MSENQGAESSDVGMIARLVMQSFYRRAAGRPERLPWHRESPSQILLSAVRARNGGRALDVGCGAGQLVVKTGC